MGVDGIDKADIFDEYFDDEKPKYIIKNCPMYFHTNCYGHTGNYNCEDCTDCIMKQIVELLQQYDEENFKWCEPISFNTENIYELLDIEEVE